MANPSGPRLIDHLQPILELLHRQDLEESVTRAQTHEKVDIVQNLLHRQQEAELTRKLNKLKAADIAHLLGMISGDKRQMVWKEIGNRTAGQVLLDVSASLAETLIAVTDEARMRSILGQLDVDELAELADVVPEWILESIKAQLESGERIWLEKTLRYPDDSVGEIMSMDSLLVKQDKTLDETIALIRHAELIPEQMDKLFVTNRRNRLVGVVPISQLLRHDGAQTLESVMAGDVVYFSPYDKAREAGLAFERYDLLSAPVVDDEHRVIGRLTVIAVMDYLREKSEDLAMAKAGLTADADLFGSVMVGAKQRWLWLALNLVTSFVATRFIAIFEGTIAQMVALATLMPIIASVGGNTGNQTTALIIRGLALDHVQRTNIRQILHNELLIGLINGALWGGVLGLFVFALYHQWILSLVLALAMLLNMLVAASVGIFTPVIMQKLGRDPAMGSSVILTFMTDSLGFLIFLGLATVLLV